jgi:hypothetical protein
MDAGAGDRSVDVRVGDAERHAAATALQKHFAEGRLTWEELDERLKSAYEARTRGDLTVLFGDLPEEPAPVRLDKAGVTPVQADRPNRTAIAPVGSAVLIAAAVICASLGLHFFWIFIFPGQLIWWRVMSGTGLGHPRQAHGGPRTRFGNPYARGGDRHHEVQRLRDQHRQHHHERD